MIPNPVSDVARPAWQDSLAAGDIVAFRFPHEDPGEDEPKVRPTLVLDVVTRDGVRYAHLAYGTSLMDPRRRAYAIDVRVASERDAASLHRPTRFDATRRIIVTLDNAGFELSSQLRTPVLGRLSGRAHGRMQAVRGRLHAEHDMRRADLFRRRPRDRRRMVTIEHRAGGRVVSREMRNV